MSDCILPTNTPADCTGVGAGVGVGVGVGIDVGVGVASTSSISAGWLAVNCMVGKLYVSGAAPSQAASGTSIRQHRNMANNFFM